MSAAIKNNSFHFGNRTEKEARKGKREVLRSWTLRCPQCLQTWIVIGARVGEQHKCKSCNHSFTANPQR